MSDPAGGGGVGGVAAGDGESVSRGAGGRAPFGRASVLCGLGTWVPPYVLTNEELSRLVDTSDEWIRSRTGIGQRHIADPSTATSDLGVEAGGRALKSAGSDRVDAVIVATTTPDRPCPATAPLVAARLGLGTVPAFDVGAVCTGFLYGLAAGAGLIAAQTADRVLVIGAETFSRILDPEDRSGRAIFGDGAGAVVLRAGNPEEPGALSAFDLGSDGNGSDLITVRTGGSRLPYATAGDEADPYFRMSGKAVFRNAVERMAESAHRVLARTGWPGDRPDLVVAHQANLRILHAVADRLGVPREDCFVNIDRVGNTAAASIPLALGDAAQSGALHPGDRVLMTAFGGGLTWGACTLSWPDVEAA
ncbi:beta-ketoacyl-ACP synthase III [Streptomyces sp. NPDC057136]|uniref:beta-ketoacyl-ACP synthase III n=1 Tax=Streptomyces sp. NPDC057136 TaxID=3346029 RepID=UPI00363E706C